MADEDNEPPINHFITPAEMMKIGIITRGYTRRRIKRCKGKTNVFRFKHHFEVSPCTAVWVYTDLQTTTIAAAKIKGGERDLKYFFMALYYIRKYPHEEVLAVEFDYSANYAARKTWEMMEKIRQLKHEAIIWEEDYQQGKRWVMDFAAME